MTLAGNIRYLRNRNGWSQEYIAEKLGYKSYTTVQKWESGISDPPLRTLDRLSRIFNVDIDDLTGKDLTLLHNHRAITPSAISIPVFSSLPEYRPSHEIDDIAGWENIPAEWTEDGSRFFGLELSDSSMAPEFMKGDIVILRESNTYSSGDCCSVHVRGSRATFRKVIERNDHIILQPVNYNCEPQIFHSSAIPGRLYISGVAVELRRKI